MLRAASCGLPASELAQAPWVEPPAAFALSSAIERLRANGSLDSELALTGIGRVRARLPVSAFSGRILAKPPPGLAGTVADVVALLELGRDLVLGGAGAEAADEARRELFAEATDEVTVQWARAAVGSAPPTRPAPGGADRGPQAGRFAAGRGGGPPRRPTSRSIREALVAHLLRWVPEAAFVPRAGPRGSGGPRRRRTAGPPMQAWGNGSLEVRVREPWNPGAGGRRAAQGAPTRGCCSIWSGSGTGAAPRGAVGCCCAAPGRSYGRRGWARLRWAIRFLERDGRRRRVVADVEHRYAGVVLHRERAPPFAAMRSARGVARLLLEGAPAQGSRRVEFETTSTCGRWSSRRARGTRWWCRAPWSSRASACGPPG